MREHKDADHSLLYKSNSDLAFYSAGFEACQPGQGYGPRARPYQVVHYVLKGSGILDISGHTYNIEEGDIFFIPSGSVAYYEASHTDPWTYAWTNFSGIRSQNYLQRIMSASSNGYVHRGADTAPYGDDIFRILTLEKSPVSAYLEENSILLHIISRLLENTGYKDAGSDQLGVADQVRFYLEMNYFEEVRIGELAQSLGYHPHYVTRMFKQKYGITPKRYLIELKLKKACGILLSSNLPVAVVAESVGFSDPLAFSKLFKNTFGVSPRAYRAEEKLGSGQDSSN